MKHFPPSVEGPAGPTGATGATGAAGPGNVITVTGPTNLTVGAVLDGEGLRRVGTTAVGRFLTIIGPSSAVSDPGDTANHDVTGLTVALPRAGTYWFDFNMFYTVTVNPTVVGLGISFSGTVVSMAVIVNMTASTSAFTLSQTVSDTLPTASNTSITANRPGKVSGAITVSTAGTLAIRFNRSANAVSFTAGGGGLVVEK